MMRVNGTVLSDKGMVKPAARASIAAHVDANRGIFANAVKVDGKNVYYVEVMDADGNIIYINFDVSVSHKAPYDRAEKKAKTKAQKETVDYTVGE